MSDLAAMAREVMDGNRSEHSVLLPGSRRVAVTPP
jgi:hypothetical protein